MKYSIVIPYRNREQHLQTLLPRLMQKFEGKDYEIIVAEQVDEGPFCKTILMNMAYKHAKGNILVFHDVDYYPTDDVSYDYDEDVAIYPVRRVVFLGEDGKALPEDKIPPGYQSFKYDVGNHSGGVVIVSKENFVKVNGFNSAYRGWGKEDDDFLIRFDYHQVKRRRNINGTFLSLYHPDSAPAEDNVDFKRNVELINNFLDTYWLGYTHALAEVSEFSMDGIKNGRWLKMKNLDVITKLISIGLTTRHRVKSLERTIDSIVKTVKNPQNVEIVFKVDEDDTETIEYLRNIKIPLDVIVSISPRHPLGYYGVAQYDTEVARLSRGEFFIIFADDIICQTQHWDELLIPFSGVYGVIHAIDDDNGEVKTAWFNSSKLFRTMQWFGTHPYMDRWMNQLWAALPEISVGNIVSHTSHTRDNPPDPTEPRRPPIQPQLEPHQLAEWEGIYSRVKRHLEIIGKRRPKNG